MLTWHRHSFSKPFPLLITISPTPSPQPTTHLLTTPLPATRTPRPTGDPREYHQTLQIILSIVPLRKSLARSRRKLRTRRKQATFAGRQSRASIFILPPPNNTQLKHAERQQASKLFFRRCIIPLFICFPGNTVTLQPTRRVFSSTTNGTTTLPASNSNY